MKLLILYIENIELLHPDEAESIDAGLVGVGTNKKPFHLQFIGKINQRTVYLFGTATTPYFIESNIVRIKALFPVLNIHHSYTDFL